MPPTLRRIQALQGFLNSLYHNTWSHILLKDNAVLTQKERCSKDPRFGGFLPPTPRCLRIDFLVTFAFSKAWYKRNPQPSLLDITAKTMQIFTFFPWEAPLLFSTPFIANGKIYHSRKTCQIYGHVQAAPANDATTLIPFWGSLHCLSTKKAVLFGSWQRCGFIAFVARLCYINWQYCGKIAPFRYFKMMTFCYKAKPLALKATQ